MVIYTVGGQRASYYFRFETGRQIKEKQMICHVCGSEMKRTVTDMPFKLRDTSIVVVKELPVIQCESCREYLLDAAVMEQVEGVLSRAGKFVEFEVVRLAA